MARQADAAARVDLYWIPLGAGGWFVRFNGRVYEAILGRLQRRAPTDLYHTALIVSVGGSRHIIENAWPIPRGDLRSRGSVVQGPVGTRFFGLVRVFRYEVRCWLDGTIPDLSEAVDSPLPVSADAGTARRLLAAVPHVPPLIWGRDALGVGDMWNSNSTVSWLLERSGIDAEALAPPEGGRAPGWTAGIVAARDPGRVARVQRQRRRIRHDVRKRIATIP